MSTLSTPLRSQRQRPARTSGQAQRGAATLIVVMILFFIITLAAAYANRNLIFEQRTATNQYRSTSSQEAAEAGVEWAVTMLNSGRIDESCVPTTDSGTATNKSFRQRYLAYGADGKLSTQPIPPSPGAPPYAWSACSFDGTAWSCSCPRPGQPLAAKPLGIAAFGVRFTSAPPLEKPGAIRIEVNGCNTYNTECLTGVRPNTDPYQCQSTTCAVLAQFTALRLPPAAAVTAGTTVDGTRLKVYNADATSGGLTVHTGGPINIPFASSGLVVGSAAGSPPTSASTRQGDGALAALETYVDSCSLCVFSSVFGLRPDTYRNQQGVLQIDCSAGCVSAASTTDLGKALNSMRGGSSAYDYETASYTDRGLVLWLKGSGVGAGLTLSNASDVIGSELAPVTLIVEGTLTINGPARIYGLVYAKNAVIDDGAPGVGAIRGALVSATTVSASGGPGTNGSVSYDRKILERVQKSSGTFVRVPGSWKDFP